MQLCSYKLHKSGSQIIRNVSHAIFRNVSHLCCQNEPTTGLKLDKNNKTCNGTKAAYAKNCNTNATQFKKIHCNTCCNTQPAVSHQFHLSFSLHDYFPRQPSRQEDAVQPSHEATGAPEAWWWWNAPVTRIHHTPTNTFNATTQTTSICYHRQN